MTGIFDTIKNVVLGKAEPAEARKQAGAPRTAPTSALPSANKKVEPVGEIDVEARLDALEGADRLNWRSSIVDLMKLVGLDPSYEARKELANELGDLDYTGKAEENVHLHKQVMARLVEHGGRVPPELR